MVRFQCSRLVSSQPIDSKTEALFTRANKGAYSRALEINSATWSASDQVRLQDICLPAFCLDLRLEAFGFFSRLSEVQDDITASPGNCQGQRATDPEGTSGDQDCFSA